MAEKRDFLEDDYEDEVMDGGEFDDDVEEDRPHPLVTLGVFLGLVVLAAIICAILWSVTHRDEDDEMAAGTIETVQNIAGEVEITSSESVSTEDSAAAESEVSAEDIVADEEPDNVIAESETPESEPMVETQVSEVAQEPISGNESMEFTEVGDTVTAKDVTNLRSVPSTLDSENVVAQLLNGETLSRTGVNDSTGWSRLEYNGQTVYAVSGYLTTDLDYKTPAAPGDFNRITTQDGRVIIFSDCDDYVTPKEYVNLRIEPSTSQGQATVKCQISSGTVVHRTGYSQDSGWSRVEYNGEVLYVVSSMVYTTEPL